MFPLKKVGGNNVVVGKGLQSLPASMKYKLTQRSYLSFEYLKKLKNPPITSAGTVDSFIFVDLSGWNLGNIYLF